MSKFLTLRAFVRMISRLRFASLFQFSLCTFGFLFLACDISIAQVTSDDTVNTQVNQNGNVSEITGGETRGGNLFHSFQDFSVSTGSEAAFLNSNDIANIFSRVTGGSISNIDGLISANGSANLFLINPAGIIFGESARLDVGGSFYASSASSILFEDGEFSATDLENPPVLTINAPIGLNLRDNPEPIVNRSFVENSNEENVGLEVAPGNNLAFIGGNINFEAGEATASGGNITLGGLSEAGTVGFNQGSFSFPEDITKADITLSNGADVDASGAGGGNITVNARNLSLTAGEFGSSFIGTGIRTESTSAEAQAGNIALDVAENITLDDSRIFNQVDAGGVGNSGNITINTGSLEAINGGDVDASTFGQGNAGAVDITATGDITASGEDSEGFQSGITSLVDTDAEGSSGGVTISTTNLNLTAGGRVDGSTLGQGDAGAVDITATGDITASGEDSEGFQSGIASLVDTDAEGNAGGITISTANLNLTAGGRVDGSTLGQGNAGAVDITATKDLTFDGDDSGVFSQVNPTGIGNAAGVTISTNNLNLTNGGSVDASTFGQGNAGAVDITATGDIIIDGEDSGGFTSGITSQVFPGAVGNAGGVTVSTNNLTLNRGGDISTSTFGQGNAGAVDITATGDITIDGEDSTGLPSEITSQVFLGTEGDAGGVTISTTNLNLTNGGSVDASTLGQGNAGAVNITATGDITIDGEDSADLDLPSEITSQVFFGAEGDAGGITISTTNLNLTNGGKINADTFGQGNAGAVNITATGDITASGEDSFGFPSEITSQVDTDAVGDAGGVTISTTNLNLTSGGSVDASTLSQGNAGTVNITATGNLTFDGENSFGTPSGATSRVDFTGIGNAGGVTISTANLNLTNGGRVDASTFGQGNAGAVDITATGDITADGEDLGGLPSGVTSGVDTGAVGNAEGITISTNNLALTNGGRVAADAFGQGNAGAVDITATGDITADGEDSDGFPSGITSLVDIGAVGNAGGITISTSNLTLTNGGRINASTLGQGNAGTVTIDATESIFISGAIERFRSGISADALTENGNGGDLNVSTNQLTIANGGTIQATNFASLGEFTPGTGQPGNIFIQAKNLDLVNGGRIDAATQFETQSETEASGKIDLQIAEDITLQDNSFISAQAFNNADGGNLTIDARFVIGYFEDGDGNDLVATADNGEGGKIDLNVQQIFGLQPGNAIDTNNEFINNNTNDIDASSNIDGLDGTVNINNDSINPIQGATELPSNVIEPKQTTEQVCQANREVTAKNGLVINGKGGIPATPDQPLSSQNIMINGETTSAYAIPEPIETSQGKIQPARGAIINEAGDVILTAYPTNNSGERIPVIKPNCI